MVRPELKEANCPYMRSMLNASDAPSWDPKAQEMNVEDLVRFVQDQPGNGSLDKVLKFFAISNHGLGNRFQRLAHLATGPGGRFSTRLVGSDGDHQGDSRIYNPETGEFDQEQFTRFTGFSSDGQTMTVADLGKAIVDANQRHNGSPSDTLLSAGEFALLCALLGDDAGAIRISDMERLFRANEFPEGARENLGSRTAQQWLKLARQIADAISKTAIRSRHHEGEMKSGNLKKQLDMVYSPLLKLMKS
jgi:hypothetical protein